MAKLFNHTNSKCLQCGVLEEHMIRWGALIFCNSCAKIILNGNAVTYQVWLKKHVDILNTEYEKETKQ